MLKGKVLWSALSLDVKTLLSRDYWGLRIRMLGGLLLWGNAALQGMRKRVRA